MTPSDPLSVFFAKTAIEVSLAKIDLLFREIAKEKKWKVERCERFLEVCSQAIWGLETEYEEILVQAGSYQGTTDEAAKLSKRINEYLTLEKLRTKFHDAIEGLSSYQKTFEQKATSYLEWPWKREDKMEAAIQFAETLTELNVYLKKLDEEKLPHRPMGTGVGHRACRSILNRLDIGDDNQSAAIRELSNIYLRERDKEPMFEWISQIRKLIEKLHKEFR